MIRRCLSSSAFIWLAMIAGIQAQETLPPAASANPAPAAVETTAPVTPAQASQSAAESEAEPEPRPADTFVPTEDISEDRSVSFPVDI